MRASRMPYGVLGAAGKLDPRIVEAAKDFVAEADGSLMPDTRPIPKVEVTRWAYKVLHLVDKALHEFHDTNNGRLKFLQLVEEAHRAVDRICAEDSDDAQSLEAEAE
ncbi:hypothetical protein Efla_004671 [Eimeria flavescens]